MKPMLAVYHRYVEWGLGALVVISSLVVWVMTRQPGEQILTVYDIFPLFGLIAFGLMWTHFVMGAIRRYADIDAPKTSMYKTVSMGVVLGLILLHPGLLWLGLYSDGYGLPPASHMKAYEDQILFVGLGTLGLTIFLAFELKRWFARKSWWKYVEYAQILGMIAIFFHAVELGNELRMDWFMLLWWFYGVTLAMSIIYSRLLYKKKEQTHGTK
jgi:hypothetical protein